MGNSSSSNDHEDDAIDSNVVGNDHAPSPFRANQVVYDEEDPFDGVDTLGYRVLGVQPDSPAATAGLVSFLDFLIGVDQQMLLGSGEHLEPGEEYDDIDLPAYLEEHKNQEIEFLVWNIKSQTARLVSLIPNDTWGGAGLLGVTIRLDNYAGAEDRLVRVLSVQSPHSPAGIAGLVPEHDYILGTTHHTLDSVDSLSRLLYQHLDQILELYVYNTQTDMVRVVALVPTRHWEPGGGILGAEVATGYLHRLPLAARNTAGISVQRKVRYKPTTTTSSQQEQQPQQVVLELEPQLEMEIVSDDDDEVESVALQEENQKQQTTIPKTPSRTTPPESSTAVATTKSQRTDFATPQRGEGKSAATTNTDTDHQHGYYYNHEANSSINNNATQTTPTNLQQHQSSPSVPSISASSALAIPTTESSSSAPSTLTVPSHEAVLSPTSSIPQPRTFIPSPQQRKPVPRAPSSAGIDPIEVGAIFERKPLSGEIAGGSPSQIGDLAPQKQPNPYRAQSLGSSGSTTSTTGGKEQPQSIHDHPPPNSTTAHVSAATAAATSSSYASYGTSSYYGAGPQSMPLTCTAPPPLPPGFSIPSSTYQPSASSSVYGPAAAATYTTSHYAAAAAPTPADGLPYNPTQPPYPHSAASYSFSYNPPNPAIVYPNPSSSQVPGTLPPPPKQFHYSAST